MTEGRRAQAARSLRARELASDPAVVAAVRAMTAASERPLVVRHKGHDAGLRVHVWEDGPDEYGGGVPAVQVVALPHGPAAGTVDGIALTCGECGQTVRMSEVRMLRTAVEALAIRTARGRGRGTWFVLS